jgi:DNA-binding HxlR family transcriptional regulator
MIAFDVGELDPVIHGRLRLGIMAYLSSAQTAPFSELKQLLQASDGNLSSNLRTLEEAGYLVSEKAFVSRRPVTRFTMTEAGRKAFAGYLDAVAKLLNNAVPV